MITAGDSAHPPMQALHNFTPDGCKMGCMTVLIQRLAVLVALLALAGCGGGGGGSAPTAQAAAPAPTPPVGAVPTLPATPFGYTDAAIALPAQFRSLGAAPTPPGGAPAPPAGGAGAPPGGVGAAPSERNCAGRAMAASV